ncbi:MAG: HEAT repeat domain-containing protein [Verrucomicrobia bacterium]|nr:HEAT repeat domain-containing protein [Verrucomicrobiota bacterium]
MRKICWLFIVAITIASATLVTAESVTLETAPPVVVKTVPVAGAKDVDPTLTEISVTYSKPMQDGSWSWSTWGEGSYPETMGKPRYLSDQRTCVLPVKLEPAKFYAIWLNSDKFKNFKDANGRSAVPYLLTFFTTGATAAAGATRDNVIVEDLALRMLAAIRDKEDDVLKELSVDCIKGWRDALPHFAFELRERFQQLTGKPFGLQVGESLVDGNYAAVKCTGPKELAGKHLVLFFLKTEEGWRNSLIRNSPPETSLSEHLAYGIAEMRKNIDAAGKQGDSVSGSTAPAAPVRDDARAVALFNDIENILQGFDATFKAKNLEAARSNVRRLSTLLTNFNAVMKDPDYQFSATLFDDIAKMGQALEEGNWEMARELARHDEEHSFQFTVIANHIIDLAKMERLNDDQRAILEWTDRQFRGFFDARTFNQISIEERAELETRLLDQLKGPHNRDYYTAINSLAALRSKKAIEPLRAIALDRADKDNRDRWMAIRALGILGDKASVPELIHLVYHGNVNTRWWAQISLVRMTGQNFGEDWKAWGEWWNKQNGQPSFKPEIIRWWTGQPKPDKLAETLGESDRNFLDKLRGMAK